MGWVGGLLHKTRHTNKHKYTRVRRNLMLIEAYCVLMSPDFIVFNSLRWCGVVRFSKKWGRNFIVDHDECVCVFVPVGHAPDTKQNSLGEMKIYFH